MRWRRRDAVTGVGSGIYSGSGVNEIEPSIWKEAGTKDHGRRAERQPVSGLGLADGDDS